MTLQAAAVEILVEKAKFEPAVALGIAEAIEVSVMHAQFVTIPVFDAKVQELKAEIRGVEIRLEAMFEAKLDQTKAELGERLEKMKAELMRWVLLAMLGSVALTAATTGLVKALPL